MATTTKEKNAVSKAIAIERPCNTCIHKGICIAEEEFENFTVENVHPFMTISIKCKQFIPKRVNGQ